MHTFKLPTAILLLFLPTLLLGQSTKPFIVVDQFGYLPNATKVAVIRDPQTGFDANQSFSPGSSYTLVDASTGEDVYTGNITQWNSGMTNTSSGDKAWWFDFSQVTDVGEYYVLDKEHNVKSYAFKISPSVYNEVLKHAMRTFYYQRVGFEKKDQYAGEAWSDGASHMGNGQDPNARLYNNANDPSTERDVSGGWYDAGDYNKYTSWTANYVVALVGAYLDRPEAWGDDYNIPESGNGTPDILDEVKWGVDHLLRLQSEDGGVLCIVDEDHASPPSAATGPSLYGPATTSATLNTAAALAISAKAFRQVGKEGYASQLETKAIAAWDWAVDNPTVLFYNNDANHGTVGIGAGQQEENDYGRLMSKIEAACFLFDVTGDTKYRDFFNDHYLEAQMMDWGYVYPFQAATQDMLLHYTTIDEATISVVNDILSTYQSSMLNSEDNFPAFDGDRDPYRAHLKDYVWGSNNTKSQQGGMFYNIITYDVDGTKEDEAYQAALNYVHYIHGINPLNIVYLSNMYDHGGDNCVNEFYHTWFADGSSKWDRVGESTYGPPPGFLVGGPNPSYDVDGCCPNNCGGANNNSKCSTDVLSPPLNQPNQKSYKDWNTSWPQNSWAVTENSCSYQVSYVRLLSKFVDLDYDCNGDKNGVAFFDVCSNCVGGNTGLEPENNPENCNPPSSITSIREKTIEYHIYPNPSNEVFTVVAGNEEPILLQVLDITGKPLYRTVMSKTAQVDMKKFSDGIYLIQLHSKSKVFSTRIVKN